MPASAILEPRAHRLRPDTGDGTGRSVRGPRAPRSERRPGPYTLILVGSLLLAAASLLVSAAVSYDPWAWLIWGRQVIHLSLVTTGGPTWKPFPVLFTTLYA